MKIIISEKQNEKLGQDLKVQAIQKLIDTTITNRYDFVCKVVITPPHHYNLQYSAHIYFKDISETRYSVSKYFQKKEDVMNELWFLVHDFTNETVSLYQKYC